MLSCRLIGWPVVLRSSNRSVERKPLKRFGIRSLKPNEPSEYITTNQEISKTLSHSPRYLIYPLQPGDNPNPRSQIPKAHAIPRLTSPIRDHNPPKAPKDEQVKSRIPPDTRGKLPRVGRTHAPTLSKFGRGGCDWLAVTRRTL